jgi:hypothetical protein
VSKKNDTTVFGTKKFGSDIGSDSFQSSFVWFLEKQFFWISNNRSFNPKSIVGSNQIFLMKNALLFILFLSAISHITFSQDTLVLKSSSRIIGKIRKFDSAKVFVTIQRGSTRIETNANMSDIRSIRPNLRASSEFGSDTIYKYNMDRIIGKVERMENDSVYINDIVTGLVEKMVLPITDIQSVGMRSDKKIKEQYTSASGGYEKENMVSLGIGLGMDHGGYGLNLAVYPEKHVGLFAGVGYAIVAPGFNGGIKLRLFSDGVTPFVSAMYGYNAVISVQNAFQYNKIFYGMTYGLGVDMRVNPEKNGFFSFGLLIPIRDKAVEEYMDDLQKKHNVSFKSGLLPIGLSFSYRFIIK